MVIDGTEVDAAGGRTFVSLDPYRHEPWASVPDGDERDVARAVAAARAALSGPWGRVTAAQRGRILRAVGDLVADHADRLAELDTRDSGRLLREMRGHVALATEWFHYYSGLADKLDGRVIPSDRADHLLYTRLEPVGVVAAILPWNFPALSLAFKLAPALAAGCTVVVKPSEHTSATALEIARLLGAAGVPDGVVNVVTGCGPVVPEALVSHPDVDKVTFTGSAFTGSKVAGSAGRHLTRVALELGGKSPQVVFPDADLEAAAQGIAAGAFLGTGQNCSAGTRIVVHRDVQVPLMERVAELAGSLRQGDPMSPDTELAPLANRTQFEKVCSYFDSARAEGAEIVCGGAASELGGYFVEPTVITNATPDLTIYREEVFGPVVASIPFTDEKHAIALANDTNYGLAAGVWTKDIHRAHRVAHAIKAGTVWINTYRLISPIAPFGGMKQSGMGREHGFDGILAYTETKSIWVELSG